MTIIRTLGSKIGHRNNLVLIFDVLISLFSSCTAVLIYRWLTDPSGSFNRLLGIWMLVSLVASLFGLIIMKTNRIVIRHSTYRSIAKLFWAVFIKECLMILFSLTGILNRPFGDIVSIVLIDALVTLLFLILIRLLVILIYDSYHENDLSVQVKRMSVMVYGVDNNASSTMVRLSRSMEYSVQGFLTHDKAREGQIIHGKPVYVYSSLEDLAAIRNQKGLDCVVFSFDGDSPQQTELVSYCLRLGIHVLNAPNIDEVRFGSMSQMAIQDINRSSEYILDGMTSFERNVKRIADCLSAFILLILFSPLFLICYLAIKKEDHGPAIYKQERIGRFGHPFNIYKFRSMKLDAEKYGPALYSGEDDPRLTKVGKFLRSHHLDELPQLWNVFTGDMAFIGYRPERKFYIDQIMEVDPRYFYLYQIRPGVTSYATLKNGYTDTMEKMLTRLEYDLYYLRHRSWWLDYKILGMTFLSIVFGKKF